MLRTGFVFSFDFHFATARSIAQRSGPQLAMGLFFALSESFLSHVFPWERWAGAVPAMAARRNCDGQVRVMRMPLASRRTRIFVWVCSHFRRSSTPSPRSSPYSRDAPSQLDCPPRIGLCFCTSESTRDAGPPPVVTLAAPSSARHDACCSDMTSIAPPHLSTENVGEEVFTEKIPLLF